MAAAEPRTSAGPQDLTGKNVGRFAIRSLLATGGMGEVYLADDTRLKRPVALKHVARKLSSDPRSRERILKEAERASALNCAYIAAVYDVFEENDEVFLVMEYVEGESLRQRLRTAGPFPIAEFLQFAQQCAEALAMAQKKGIVHRDLKPDNIMIAPSGQAKVLDFGLAKRVAPSDEEELTVSSESQNWAYAGTPGYIAPEVLLGGEADHRSDIFSLGVVFYEMLTGQHPFRANNRATTAGKTLQSTPKPVHELVPGVSAEVEHIVSKMLAKSPDERYASATDVLADLRAEQTGSGTVPVAAATPRRSWHIGRVIALALIVIVVLALVPVVRQQWKRRFVGSELPEKKNLAVLPFMVVGEDPGAHAFAQGLAETLTGKLSQLTDNYPLQVVPPSEIRSQKVSSVEQARAGVGANLVLEGSLQRSGSLVRVTYHLVDARNRQQLRADIVTAQAADPFAVEDRVVQSVVRSLDLELGAKERQALRARGTAEPAAYDYYLRGRGYLMEYQNPENIDSAIEVFRRSLESDPKYTLAYAGLGESYWHKYEASHASEWVGKALENCEKAAALGEGAICLGHVYNGTGKYEKAADEFQRALQLDSTSDDAYRGLAFAYEHLGKTAEAEQTYRHAIAVRPQYWAGYNWLGTFLFRQGRFDEAARSFLQVTTLAPDSYRGYQNLGGAYTAMGRFNEALPALERSVQVRPTSTAYSNLGTVYFYLGRFSEAARTNEQAVKLDSRNYVLWGNLADAYYWTPGERDKAPAAYVNARSLAEEQLKVNPRDASALGQVALDHAMLRERDAASQNIQHALALAPADPDLQLEAAIIALQFGNSEQSINYVSKALDAGLSPVLVKDHPAFETLRSDKRFVQILTGHSSKQP